LAQEDEGEDFSGGDTEAGDEPPISVNGYFKAQSGVFVPLISDGFKPQKNRLYGSIVDWKGNRTPNYEDVCDPVKENSQACVPLNHGIKPGTLSMGRSVFLLDGEWRPNDKTRLRAIFRAVRSIKLDQDEWATSLPKPPANPDARRGYAEDWIQQNVYNEFDLRELYIDTSPADWLSLRIGRQQISWGETGQYRLLDVINPLNETWHPAVLESFEDTRIPLWMAKATIDFGETGQSLELVWVPLFLDRPEDTVSTSLGWTGAWGVPWTNTPTSYTTAERVFNFPGGRPKDMRGGARWKGELSGAASFSLVYFYNHQLSPVVPTFFDQVPGDSTRLKRAVLDFPRQHIAGATFDYVFAEPIGMVLRLEGAVEPDRTYSGFSTVFTPDPDGVPNRFVFDKTEKLAVSYAVVLGRPTMIRFLNPTQNITFQLTWMHTVLPGLSDKDKSRWVNVFGYNDNTIETHDMRIVFVMFTSYMNGFIAPRLIAVYSLPDSKGDMGGLWTVDVAFRLGDYWRLKFDVTDFFGSDAYKGIGYFRDRDEVNASLTYQF